MKKILFGIVTIVILSAGVHSWAMSHALIPSLFHPDPYQSQVVNKPFVKKPLAKKLLKSSPQGTLYGIASWYSETDPFINLRTANGEVFDDSKLTCASWDFPFHSYVKVTNLANGKSVTCRINDRGPVKRLHRLIDLTKATFRKIADPRVGLIKVSVKPVSKPKATKSRVNGASRR